MPTRGVRCDPLPMVPDAIFEEFEEGSDGRDISTTMAFVRVLTRLLKDKQVGRLIVPMAPALMPLSSTQIMARTPETKPIPTISEEPGTLLSALLVSAR